jgi:hypothetical protein
MQSFMIQSHSYGALIWVKSNKAHPTIGDNTTSLSRLLPKYPKPLAMS